MTGASSGIGRATAVGLAGEGASVLLIGRGEGPLREVAHACVDVGARAEPMTLDITDADAGERLVAGCLERFGRLDVLVNNAGTSAIRRCTSSPTRTGRPSGSST